MTIPYDSPTHEKVHRRTAVEAITGLSRSSLYREIAAQKFPPPIRLGKRSVGWLESEINKWLEGRIKATRGEAANK